MSTPSVTVGIDTALGAVAPLPRSNGELVFEEPWQSRAFGMAVGLHQRGLFEWEDFRQHLIARIAAWEATRIMGEPYVYYMHWLGALEDVVTGAGIVSALAIEAEAKAIAALPPDADHRDGDHGQSGHDHPHKAIF